MTDPPPSPASVTDPDNTGPENRPAPRMTPWQKAVGAIGLVVVLWVGYDSTLLRAWFDDGGSMDQMPDDMDHGPSGDPGPGSDAPEENQDVEVDPDDGDPAPPADSGEHDPSQWDH